MNLYIGIDLGTSAMKLLLMDAEGTIVNIVTEEYPLEFPKEGWSQQNPEDWAKALWAGLPKLLSGVDPSMVRGIGSGGQMHGLVILDEQDQVIRPAIAAGKVLLCDRFVDSSVAYQGGGRQLGVQRVLDINAPAVDGTMPVATIYLDVDHETSMARRAAATELDRMELAGDSFHARTEAGYRELIARDPARFIVVDATRTPEEIGREVAERVLGRLMEAE